MRTYRSLGSDRARALRCGDVGRSPVSSSGDNANFGDSLSSSFSLRATAAAFFVELVESFFGGCAADGPAQERTASSICSAVDKFLSLSFDVPVLTDVVRIIILGTDTSSEGIAAKDEESGFLAEDAKSRLTSGDTDVRRPY